MLNRRFSLFLCLCFSCYTQIIDAQSDTIKQAKNFYKEYEEPWEKKTNLKNKELIPKIGIYISLGIGYPHDYKYGGIKPAQYIIDPHRKLFYLKDYFGPGGVATLSNYAFSFKSHMVSLTFGNSSAGTYLPTPSGFTSNYHGILFGESISLKHFLISFSVGLAHTNLFIQGVPFYNTHTLFGYLLGRTYINEFTSFPIELKAFYLVSNFLGIGLHISENIVPFPKYSPFSACISVMFGIWNYPKLK